MNFIPQLVTAAYVSSGMHNNIQQFDAAREILGTGDLELTTTGMEYVEYIESLYQLGYLLAGSVPGVFDYEVTEAFGYWYIDYIYCTKQLPTVGQACQWLKEGAFTFFWGRNDNKKDILGGPDVLTRAFDRVPLPAQPVL